MTIKQIILKWLYPLFLKSSKNSIKASILTNEKNKHPNNSFYGLKTTNIKGEEVDFSKFEGKKVLLVNTASNCGYTGQYESLQDLSENFKDQLVVLGFPSNDFKEQEKSSNEEISQFCQINFGVTFSLMKKSIVLKGESQNMVFEWLTKSGLNGWNNQEPYWNFTKYLVNEEGRLEYVFGPAIDPADPRFLQAFKTKNTLSIIK